MADEYDAAQVRGEVASGRPKSIPGENSFAATTADLGISNKEIHDARQIRDAVDAARQANTGAPIAASSCALAREASPAVLVVSEYELVQTAPPDPLADEPEGGEGSGPLYSEYTSAAMLRGLR